MTALDDQDNKGHFSITDVKGSEVSIENPPRTYEGTVIWFGSNKKYSSDNRSSTKSFGFIEWSKDGVQQRDMFVHFSNIVAEEGEYRTLEKGQKVNFQLGTNRLGELKAIFVRKIK